MKRLFHYKTAISALALSALCSRSGHPPLPPPPPQNLTQASTLAEILKTVPQQATPFFYEGHHSFDLSHLDDKPASTNAATPPKTESRVFFPDLLAFTTLCPAFARYAANDLPAFINSLPKEALEESSRDFLLSGYFALAQFTNSSAKVTALTRINRNMAEPPIFTDYINQKRIELRRVLLSDPAISGKRAVWNTLSPRDKEATLQRIANLTLDVLLPGKNIDYPRVFYLTNPPGRLTRSLLGHTSFTYNEIYLNATSKPMLWDFQAAAQIATHEAFHIFEAILVKWQNNGHFSPWKDLDNHVRIYQTEMTANSNYIRAEQSFQGYRTMSLERAAWSFQLAAASNTIKNIEEKTFHADMFKEYDLSTGQQMSSIKIPTYKKEGTGKLPSACLETAPHN